MATSAAESKKKPKRGLMAAGAAAVVVVLLAGWWLLGGDDGATATAGTTFEVARGPLEIIVLEGGSIEAVESQEVKSEVQGQTKILSIVDEGYLVTPQDVEDGMVLVELDSKDLLDSLTERELAYQRAYSEFTQSREEFEIQQSENQSEIAAAELEVRFALMDLQKYLGEQVANEVRAYSGMDQLAMEGVPLSETGGSGEGEQEMAELAPIEIRPVDFTQYADPERLGDGEAMQKLRETSDDLVLAREELEAARTQLEGTKRLYEREFVTQQELEKDELALQRSEIKVASAETSQELFIRYEFPKESERLLSDYGEKLRALTRVRKQAIAKTAQAEAKLRSAEAQYDLQTRKKEELEEQIEKCVIRATKPGLVVYGGGGNRYWRDEDQIEEGAQVRERQVIVTIPDTTSMKVAVQVHESYVQRVNEGQRARVRVDAFPDQVLEGEVTKIAVLPDSQNRWVNPDLKVYSTDIVIDGTHDWLKPGMTAEAEIIIQQLDDVIYAPLQAVTPTNDGPVAFVVNGIGQEMREIETGEFNESFIQIKSGLEPGDRVMLRAPEDFRESQASEDDQEAGAGPPA